MHGLVSVDSLHETRILAFCRTPDPLPLNSTGADPQTYQQQLAERISKAANSLRIDDDRLQPSAGSQVIAIAGKPDPIAVEKRAGGIGEQAHLSV